MNILPLVTVGILTLTMVTVVVRWWPGDDLPDPEVLLPPARASQEAGQADGQVVDQALEQDVDQALDQVRGTDGEPVDAVPVGEDQSPTGQGQANLPQADQMPPSEPDTADTQGVQPRVTPHEG